MSKAMLPPLRILVDSREPYAHERAEVEVEGAHGVMVTRCSICGGRRECETPLIPFVIRGNERVNIPTERVTLAEGDYALLGFARWKPMGDDGEWRGERWAIVERKSVTDAISTVVGSTTDALGERSDNRERFSDELDRMRAYAFRTIVIEGHFADIQREATRASRRFNAASVIGSYLAFAPRFGVQVLPMGGRTGAEYAIGTIFARMWDEFVGGPAWKKATERADTMPWIGRGIVATEN